MRLLLVEDTPDVRRVLAEFLIVSGHEVLEAGTAQSAIDVISTQGCDMVISDVHLPDGDCIGVAEIATQKNAAVLLITGDDIFADALAEVGIPHLRKPFGMKTLALRIDEAAPPLQGGASAAGAKFAALRARIEQ